MQRYGSDRGRAFLWARFALLGLVFSTVLSCRGPSLAESGAPSPTSGGPAMRTALPASTDATVTDTRAAETAPAGGPAATSTPTADAMGRPTEATGQAPEPSRPASGAPITVRIKVITGGQSPSIDVETTGSETSTSTLTTTQEVGTGGAVVEVVVELDLGESGGPIVYGGSGSSVPGAAPPRPRETPFPPVAVGAGPGDAKRGQTLFGAKGCSGCHSIGTNTIVGPGLAGVADRAGAEAYITESIRNPAVFVVPGFANDMPPFTTLSDQDVKDLIDYLKTLK